MTKGQLKKLEIIQKRWLSFEYKGQADHDIRFLLRVLLGEDPDSTVRDAEKAMKVNDPKNALRCMKMIREFNKKSKDVWDRELKKARKKK